MDHEQPSQLRDKHAVRRVRTRELGWRWPALSARPPPTASSRRGRRAAAPPYKRPPSRALSGQTQEHVKVDVKATGGTCHGALRLAGGDS